MVENAGPGATFLLNSPYGVDQVWDHMPKEVQEQILAKKIKFYVIDAYKVAKDTGMGLRINTIMQTCFFAISGVLPREEAIGHIKKTIEKTYAKKGDDGAPQLRSRGSHTSHLREVKVPVRATSSLPQTARHPGERSGLRQQRHGGDDGRQGRSAAGVGLPVDGTWPTGTLVGRNGA
jgi:pyruvate-ferredoxin/flavodoxin oxidoreductase